MKNAPEIALSPKMQTKPQELRQGLTKLRAGVMGANDGIISTAGMVIGVSGAQKPLSTVLIAGVFMILAGALSMAGGEYVSVSSQKDMQQANFTRLNHLMSTHPEAVTDMVKDALLKLGEPDAHATELAQTLVQDQDMAQIQQLIYGSSSLASLDPITAALSDGIAFVLGAIIPLLCIALLPPAIKVIGTMGSVLLCLALTGFISAKFGKANVKRSLWRNVAIGTLTMMTTYIVGIMW
ncbi:VIT1/CCC1 transporter family protein [Lacticaseibacillus saniviri]|uniref:Integral membrane protein n=1 Tax=Lacticaseibacillus saniviri JCM 17471 = DSM 24301 TaxID=1293598 RepID=A0A0R2MSD0_9LACO|nr:VIT1/CCC1 transporter family protein [Lacticaseibacillus saniviri]KRO16484.1 hypothetical protein IV56_GL001267 [Lacticaseibacillus saniviri JCM 17471 = DSM 24301]MCG4281791.1 VIT1/CCC1 transporter family protein [Lacticaseibacillus saniviri]